MTLSEALVEIKNNKIIRRANCNTSYAFNSNTKKFCMMIKYNQHEGVKYDIKYAERDTITFYAEDLLADDWLVD
jgi:outer membrane cobalamin receptor